MSDWREARHSLLGELFHISPSAMSAAQQEAIMAAADAYALALMHAFAEYDIDHLPTKSDDAAWCCRYHWLTAQVEAERGE